MLAIIPNGTLVWCAVVRNRLDLVRDADEAYAKALMYDECVDWVLCGWDTKFQADECVLVDNEYRPRECSRCRRQALHEYGDYICLVCRYGKVPVSLR